MKIFYGTKKLCLRKTKLFLRRMQKRHSSLIVCAACGGIFGRVSVLADKLLITKQGDRLITAWTEDGRICRLQAEPLEGDGILGNIYVGKVRNIVKNINAAFVEFRKGQMGYLPLQASSCPIATDSVVHGQGRVLIGDEILVQVEREAVKTKPPTLTGRLEFAGKYVVLTAGGHGVFLSKKIKDRAVREEMSEFLSACCRGKGYALLARTNSVGTSKEELEREIAELESCYQDVVSRGRHMAQFTCLHRALPAYLDSIQGMYRDRAVEVLTDDEWVYGSVRDFLERRGWSDAPEPVLWNPEHGKMDAVFNISRTVEKALQPKVWLKSGAYLVIQPTEALVSIDVNTGKAVSKKKDVQKNFLKVNLEAAREIAVQIRLRNLSGIILVDFIDMLSKEANQELLAVFRGELGRDPVPTSLVDMTKLGLVELTRKKVRKPFYEQLREDRV